MTQVFRESFDTPARPVRRLEAELAYREDQRRHARGIAPATVTEPALHERGRPPGVEPDWIYGPDAPGVALFPSVWAPVSRFIWVDSNSHLTIIDMETGNSQTVPVYIRPLEIDRPHGSYTPFDGSFDYFGNDPTQWEHGADGGTPMTVAELLGADEKMDEIDRLLDE